jgi:hypothetical protein
MGAIDKVWLGARIIVQLAVAIPCILWFMLAALAIPGYLTAGFIFPPFCCVVGCIVCCLMLRSTWKRGREFRELFKIHIHFDDWIDADDDVVTGPLLCSREVSKKFLDFHKFELKLAFAITALLYAWSAWDWYLELYILRPAELEDAKAGTKCGCIDPNVNANGVERCNEWSELGPSCRPCDFLENDADCNVVPEMGAGVYSCKNATADNRRTCSPRSAEVKARIKAADEHDDRCLETCCPTDPNCRAWVDKMTGDYPVLYMCPTVDDGYIAYATFSCHADASWLQLTGTVALIYLITVLSRTCCLPGPKKAIKAAVPVAKEIIGMEETEEEKAITKLDAA